ncbi:MAG: alcohol dehydrogenase catalytic domain-containing protein [Thermoproteota archaeon]|jgi:2-desacetyl-2-hydroxyethyl bacteriochlorophyllide A dehydrogenase|nr:alcohol dehydrogenase catalytic domain-containing protein [Thermoproteota archaeon]
MYIKDNKAIFLIKPYSIEIKNNIIDKELDKNEVLIKIKYASICETDLKIFRGEIPNVKFPIILGHEAVGEVIETGGNVIYLSTGDKVLIDPNIYCGVCSSCRALKYNLCLNGGLLGKERDGVLQEYIIIQERNLYKLPSSVNIKSAPLIQPLSTVIHSQKLLTINPNDYAMVIGMGVTGLMHTRLLKEKGAKVLCVSRFDEKANLVKKFGGDFFLNIKDKNFEDEINKITEREGVDVLIDTSANVELIYTLLKYLKPHGQFLSFGITSKIGNIPMYELYYKEAKIIFSRSSLPKDFVDAINFVKDNRIDLDMLIDRYININNIEQILNEATHKFRSIVNFNLS